MAAADRPVGTAVERDQHRSAPAFDVAEAQPERGDLGQRRAESLGRSGSASTIVRMRRSDSSDLVEADGDARGDVAVAGASRLRTASVS